MGFREENDKRLRQGFARLLVEKDKTIEITMYHILDKALDALHEAHGSDMKHEQENDTLGWCLVHNGQIVEAVSQAKGKWTPKGRALNRLQEIVGEGPRQGWYGVVLSDMANNWYRVDYEIRFLHASVSSVIENFHKYFHKV
ncbi:MAG: hypothetical protein ACI3ZT_00935 [Candidatus Cryptobacteroides sp.]